VKLRELIDGLEIVRVQGDFDVEVAGLTYDSRRVSEGDLFFALARNLEQRRQHVNEALSRGAHAVVTETGWGGKVRPAATVVECSEPRLVMASVASRFFRAPSQRLELIGVTGTAGKTTTCFLLRSIFEAAGFSAGIIGTLGAFAGAKRIYEGLTTPEAIDFESQLATMEQLGIRWVAAEISSIGLAQHRADALHFRAAVFTNLGRDHLDFHGTLENYFAAKLKLFTEILPRTSKSDPVVVVRGDDPFGKRILDAVGVRKVSFGFDATCDVRALNFEADRANLRAEVVAFGKKLTVISPLLGEVNLPNVLAAIATSLALGIPHEAVLEGIRRCSGAPGRMEIVPNASNLTIVVDYAHKPNSLEVVLKSLRRLTKGRVLCVFGCGGERDAGKRPIMGEIAGRFADITIITSDNPRGEDPLAIIHQIESGIAQLGLPRLSNPADIARTQKGYFVEPDRRSAIEHAILNAWAGDVVLIAGKGHETYQLIGNRKLSFDDREVVRQVLKKNGLQVCA